MHPSISTRNAAIAVAAAFCVYALVSLMVAQPAWAQLPNFQSVEGSVKDTFRPVFTLVRYFIVGLCLITGFWEAFKATRGNAKGWLTAFLLFIVAGIAVSPSGFLKLFGLNTLAGRLSDYGL